MRVKDVMTRDVVTAAPDMPLSEAISIMVAKRISGLPVIDTGRLVGILSESDLLRRTELGTAKTRRRWLQWLTQPGTLAEDFVRTNGRYVRDAMTRDPQTIDENANLADVADLMERHQIKRLPVVAARELVGIVTRGDVMRALAGFLAPAYEDIFTSDREICETIRAELGSQSWGSPDALSIECHDGVVELRGTLYDERLRQAIRVAVENVPGVKSIQDHMVWIGPLSPAAALSPEDSREGRP